MRNSRAELKRAELLSSVGAGVLGAGLALVLAAWLMPYAIPLLAVGAVSHAWGMYAKHRLERDEGAVSLAWAEWLYWGCWIALLALVFWIVVRAQWAR